MAERRVLVVGAGSIGARHAGNFLRAGAEVTVTDPDAARAASVPQVHVVPFDLDRLDGYDGIVVASPTAHHEDQAFAALRTGAHVLVEKPLATSSAGLDRLVGAADGRLMVGYNLRLHRPVEHLVRMVHEGRVGTVRAVRVWFGSWLPDWRPNADYRASYSAQAALGGGVLLDAIHELDVLVWLLGDQFEVLGAVVDRLGPLDIDVEDTVRALLRHSGGAVAEVALDYLSRRYRRGVEVIGEDGTARLDWASRTLVLENAETVETHPAEDSIDRSYEREAELFLAWLDGRAVPPVDAGAGAASVRLADRIRAAAR